MPRIDNGETLDVRGDLRLTSGSVTFANGQIARTAIATNELAEYPIMFDQLKKWDNFAQVLPGTAADDDLGVIEGTLGTDSPVLQTSDAKATTVTQYTRVQFPLPQEYISGQTITVRLRGGMNTTISDGTATADVEAYAYAGDGTVGSDLCATAAQSINSLTAADKDFTITPTGLVAGDILDIRIAIAITDTATGTAVIGELTKWSILCDVR